MAFDMVPSSNISSVVANNVISVGAGVAIEPRDTDILCIRGGATMRHAGTQTYRRLVKWNKVDYCTCPDSEKIKISRSIVATLREQNRRFLSKDKEGIWYDIGDKKAIEKTSQALREGQPQTRRSLTEPLDLEVEPLPLEPVSHGEATIANPHPLPPDFFPSDFPNNNIISSGAAFDQSEHQAPIDGSQRGVSEVYAMIQPSSPAYVPSAVLQSDILYSPSGIHHHRDIPVTTAVITGSSHHRDIELNSLDVSDRPLPAQDRLLASLLKPMSLQDINSDNVSNRFQQQSSTLSGLGVSVRTVDSIAINSVNTFNSMKSNESMKSSIASEGLPVDAIPQRPSVATEKANVEALSQLSLFSGISRFESNKSDKFRGTEGDGMSVDSFQHILDGMSFSGVSQNLGSQKLTDLGRISDPNNTKTRNGDTKPNERQQDQPNGTVSHINLAAINESQMSCVTTHSAFDLNKSMQQRNMTSNGYQIESHAIRTNTDMRSTFANQKRGRKKESSNGNHDSPDGAELENEESQDVHFATSIDALEDILTGESNFSLISEMAMSSINDLKPTTSMDDKEIESNKNTSSSDRFSGGSMFGSRMSALSDAGGHLSELSLFSGFSEGTGDISTRLPTWTEDSTFDLQNNARQPTEEEKLPQRGVSMVRMGATRGMSFN